MALMQLIVINQFPCDILPPAEFAQRPLAAHQLEGVGFGPPNKPQSDYNYERVVC